MSSDFSSLLSKEDLARIEMESAEIKRIFNLPDRFLGRELLRLARAAREEDPDRLGAPTCNFYENTAVWSVIPGIAKRLGEKSFTEEEKSAMLFLPNEDEDFRDYVGAFVTNSIYAGAPKEVSASSLLSRDVANGNPVTIAMDRLSPPTSESEDKVVTLVREVSRSRFGDERFASWEPAMQDYKNAQVWDPFFEEVQVSTVLELVVPDV